MRQHRQGHQQLRSNVSNNICASTGRDVSSLEDLSIDTTLIMIHVDGQKSTFKYLSEARESRLRVDQQKIVFRNTVRSRCGNNVTEGFFKHFWQVSGSQTEHLF